MGKSYKRTPISGVTTATSEKLDKRIANRKFRRLSNPLEHDEDTILPNHPRAVSDIWSFAKDGKIYFDDKKNKEWEKYRRK